MHDAESTTHRRAPARRKRARVKGAFKSLRERLHTYRLLLAVAAAAIVGLTALLLVNPFGTDAGADAILLGRGKAGVFNVTDTTERPAKPATESAGSATDASAPGQPIKGGEASYYGEELAGNPTASGERFDPNKFTAAHRTLPLGSRVRVTNVRNGETVVVRVNDRGPFARHRVIDLSKAAAREIGMLRAGTGQVRLELIPG
ncbi:MAG: septal ring lytic transglycosylase RlpA family protein [Rhodothermales bacterium]|nr:septal ring lytic transglycosylase RlpA family protein [Rhodothermales bacterium]